ncbi:hypothetical protein HOC11_05235, partial [archaeon]|nr:hypothetical protein [archaeon]
QLNNLKKKYQQISFRTLFFTLKLWKINKLIRIVSKLIKQEDLTNHIENFRQSQKNLEGIKKASIKLFQESTKLIKRILFIMPRIKNNVKLKHIMINPFTNKHYHKNLVNVILHVVGGMGEDAGIQGMTQLIIDLQRIGFEFEKKTKLGKELKKIDAQMKHHHTFDVKYNGQTYHIIFTNDESAIPSRQEYHNRKNTENKIEHFEEGDYVHKLQKIIDDEQAPLIYILCNTASAHEELLRLRDITHAAIYDLINGFVEFLAGNNPKLVCFLSTVQLWESGSYQDTALKEKIPIYEEAASGKNKENHFIFTDGIIILETRIFYKKLTDELTNVIQQQKDEFEEKEHYDLAVLNFIELMNYIQIPDSIKIIIGLCCTEFPVIINHLLNPDELSMDAFPYKVELTTQTKNHWIEEWFKRIKHNDKYDKEIIDRFYGSGFFEAHKLENQETQKLDLFFQNRIENSLNKIQNLCFFQDPITTGNILVANLLKNFLDSRARSLGKKTEKGKKIPTRGMELFDNFKAVGPQNYDKKLSYK